MISIFDNFLGALLSTYALIYSGSKLSKNKIQYKRLDFYIELILLSAVSIFNYYFVNNITKLFLTLIIMLFVFTYFFKLKIKDSIILVILVQILFMISDGIVAIILSTLYRIDAYSLVSDLPKILTNFLVSMIVVILSQVNEFQNFYYTICKRTNKINSNIFIALFVVLIFLTNIIATIIYAKYDFRLLILFNIIYTIFCFFIVLYLLKTKNNYIKVNDKYNTTLNSLKEYETILDKYRVSNHENKNQLLTIRNMVPKSNKEVISYIDKIVENKLKDNDKILFDVSIIPAGGLRGLIYSKILYMKELNIDYQLEISNKVKTVDLISIDDSLILDICQVIGVFLDNAIQEVEKLEEKYIDIEMYIDKNYLIISISNNYEGIIEIDKIEKQGYTSKGNGHGYGLTLVNQIIRNNKRLENEKSISSESFSQILKIKM